MMSDVQDRDEVVTEPFAAWLLKQRDRGDWIDDVAAAAREDRQFPKRGDAEAVRKRLREMQADGDTFAAIDDAESEWQSA